MNWRRALTVTRKDIKEAMGNSQILLPIVLVPLIIVGAVPTGFILAVRFGGPAFNAADELNEIIENLPPAFAEQFAGFSVTQLALYFFLVFVFSAFFLLVPMMVSMMVAANSFAGEKERKTLEGLLYTPITDRELVVGKILAAFLPAMAISWLCFALYALLVVALATPVFGRIFFPTFNWWILMLWLVPTTSFLVIGIVVTISARVRGSQEANSLAGAIVLPVVLLAIGQLTGVMYFSAAIVFLAGALFALIDVILLRAIVSSFHRDRLLAYFK